MNKQFQVAVQESVVPQRVDDEDVEMPTVEVIAEITTNHLSYLDRLEKLVRAAQAAGAAWGQGPKARRQHLLHLAAAELAV